MNIADTLPRLGAPARPLSSQGEGTRLLVAASLAINTLVLAIPLYINRIYVSVLPQQASDSLLYLTLLLAAVILLDLILRTARAWLMTLREAREEHRLRLGAVRALLASTLQAGRQEELQARLDELHSPAWMSCTAPPACGNASPGSGSSAPLSCRSWLFTWW
ncbi:MAG: hypothetical protein ACOVNL_04860 [Prochlorococcaceae cyanobacterium]